METRIQPGAMAGFGCLIRVKMTQVAADPTGSGLILVQIFVFRDNPLKYTDPDGRYNLSASEKEFKRKHPVSFIATGLNGQKAYALEKQLYGSNTRGTRGDALRHSLWSALNAQTNGLDLALEYGDAHERSEIGQNAEARADLYMDIHNNAIGADVGIQHPNAGPDELSEVLVEKINNGEMLMLKMFIGADGRVHNDGNLYRSNDTEYMNTLSLDDPSINRSQTAQEIYNGTN
jgi:hypothetical protein